MACFLSYTSSVTGDCSNTNIGSFSINIDGSAPDYLIQWLSPTTGTTSLGVGVTAYTQTNLSAGTYSFNIIDSCISGNTVLPVNIYVSSGTCVSITDITDTVCSANNGTLTVENSNYYGSSIFSLYNNTTGLISTQTPGNNSYTFTNLPSGTYYVIGDDGGGCTGKSESVIIKNSSNLSFGLYTVDNAGCAVDSGRIFITGLTGTPPYSYLWSNGSTNDSITGLTEGTYTVTVTDSSLCSVSNTSVIYNVPKVGLGAIYLTQPSCFTADGEIEIIITGGTAPFYYLGSNGVTNVTFDRNVTFTGLGPGGFTIQVVDAGLCTFTTSTSLLTPNGISVVSVDITNSTCNDLSGVIGPIIIFGGTSPYTYSLTDSLGNVNSTTIYGTSWQFDGLSSGVYDLSITDGNGVCTFTSAYTISNVVTFDLTTSTTGTTCSGNDGIVRLDITSGGTPPYTYNINGQSVVTSLTSYTFNNLFSGNYLASVTDSLLCYQSSSFTVTDSTMVDFHLLSVESINGDGSISSYVTNGEPPFTLYWSGDVGVQTGFTVSNLPAGEYSLRIVDSNGCSKTKKVPIRGYNKYGSTGYYEVCSGVLNQEMKIQSGPKQYLNEGYNELISLYPGYSNCILTAATFQALITAGTYTDSSVFYVADSLTDYPSDEEWFDVITTLIEGSPQIGSGGVVINPINDIITITTNCEPESLHNSNVYVKMRIDYEIECVCPPPTPTQTPSSTPNVTLTPTPSITPSITPTMTMTPSITPTMTATPPLLYYVYRQCGVEPSTRDNDIIQPMPALIGNNIIGQVVLNEITKVCWTLIDISPNVTQLQNIYIYNTLYHTNYFTQLDGNIYDNCADCEIAIAPVVREKCDITINNASNCARANTTGQVFVNNVLRYSFDENFGTLTVTEIISAYVGDTIEIVITAPLNGICSFSVNDANSDGSEYVYTDTVTNGNLSFSYRTLCGSKKQIDFTSTCP